jgi:tetratricopeptide (TPR) repeat protein
MPFAVEDEAETCTQQSEAALLRSDAATALRFYREGIAALTGASPEARWRYSLQAADSLQEFGNRAGRNEALLASIELYKLALRTADRDRVPLDWATTQTNLGNALLMLGERESGTGRLEEAVAAFRAALEERTRDRVPLDWAASTGNQGIALMLLAKRLGDASRAHSAIGQIEVAFVTMRDGGNAPAAAYYKTQLAKAKTFSIH